MARISVSTVIDAAPHAVWTEVEDLGSHVEWMRDAAAIRFTSERTSGVGTTFECDTEIGPLRVTDRMEVTAWDTGRSIGVRHVSLVTGEGTFTLSPAAGGRTRFEWREELRFPWWLGGRLGGAVAAPILRRVWERNLHDLRRRIEAG